MIGMTNFTAGGHTDVSTPNSFGFLFHCERCGASVASETYALETGGLDITADESVRTLLWTRQHKSAYARARADVEYEFNVCPRCGRRVCSKCFCAGSGKDDCHCIDCDSDMEE